MSEIKSSHELWFVKARDYKGLRETFDALDDEIDKLEAENAALKKAEEMVERLIEAGNPVVYEYIQLYGWTTELSDAWHALVTEWKEREE